MGLFEALFERVFAAFSDVFGAAVKAPIEIARTVSSVDYAHYFGPFKNYGVKFGPFLPSENDVDTCARTIWGEARGEGQLGMTAVMNVIYNRVRTGGFGSGFAGVCKAPKQFSAWNSNDPNYQKILSVTADNDQFADALEIAWRGVAGQLPDITKGALYYYATSISSPSWALSMNTTAVIGQHRFLMPETA